MLENTDQEILQDLNNTYNLIKEERKQSFKDLSSTQKNYALSQENYSTSIKYYKEKNFEISLVFYELGQLYYSKYLKQKQAISSKTTAKQS